MRTSRKRNQQRRQKPLGEILQISGVYTTICEFLPLGDRHTQRRISRWFSTAFRKTHKLFLPIEVAKNSPIFTLRRGYFCTYQNHDGLFVAARVCFSTRDTLNLRTCSRRGRIQYETYPRCLRLEPNYRSPDSIFPERLGGYYVWTDVVAKTLRVFEETAPETTMPDEHHLRLRGAGVEWRHIRCSPWRPRRSGWHHRPGTSYRMVAGVGGFS